MKIVNLTCRLYLKIRLAIRYRKWMHSLLRIESNASCANEWSAEARLNNTSMNVIICKRSSPRMDVSFTAIWARALHHCKGLLISLFKVQLQITKGFKLPIRWLLGCEAVLWIHNKSIRKRSLKIQKFWRKSQIKREKAQKLMKTRSTSTCLKGLDNRCEKLPKRRILKVHKI